MTREKVAKHPKDCAVEMIQQVQPGHTNSLGTVFGGQVLSWIDMAAAVTAMRHVEGPVVTASIDTVDFHAPARNGHVMVLRAQVNFAGRTSLEVGVEVTAEDPFTRQSVLTTEALLTFVAIDEKGRPVKVPPLIPETDIEKKRFAAAQSRRELRKNAKS